MTATEQQFGRLFEPIKKDMTTLQENLVRYQQDQHTAYGSLSSAIKSIVEQSQDIRKQTSEWSLQTAGLVSALKNPTTRGRWGEIQLKRIVEMAGMLDWCDFDEQTAAADAGRPDMTVHLPGKQVVYVDAKAPLAAYLAELEETDEGRRAELRKEHARAVRAHVDALSRRAYHNVEGSIGFTIMYVPGEAFLQAAMDVSPDLIEYAAAKNIYICGPLTLLPLLRSCAFSWRQQRQEQQAQEIAKLGATLYDRLRVFATHFAGVGASIGTVVERYNEAVGSFETRLLPQGRRIKDVAALGGPDLPAPIAIDALPRKLAREQNHLTDEATLFAIDGRSTGT